MKRSKPSSMPAEKTMSPRRTPRLSISLFISIAFACLVGSEHGQSVRGSGSPHRTFLHSMHRLLGGFTTQGPSSDTPLLTDEQLDAYLQDGYIVISGLLDTDEVDSLMNASEDLVAKQIEKTGGTLPSNKNFQVNEFGLVLNERRFRDVALHSKLPRAAAELMQLDGASQNLRVLR